jgi:hypothetical protein
VSRYRVCFDGKWQESFSDREDALDWGRAVGDTGRIVHVVKSRLLLNLKLIAVFPEAHAAEAKRLWEARTAGQRAASTAALVGPGLNSRFCFHAKAEPNSCHSRRYSGLAGLFLRQERHWAWSETWASRDATGAVGEFSPLSLLSARRSWL